jgi:DNA-binding NtrC family response regulator
MPQLLIHRGASFCREYVFSGVDQLTIGRARSNDIHLPDSSRRVSRYHAAVVRAAAQGETYFVRDLGSLRSTRVFGHAVSQHVLREGDVVEIGDYELVFSARERTEVETSPLRVVAAKAEPGAMERSTALFTHHELMRDVPLTGPQKELVESVLQAARKSVPAAEILGQIVAPLIEVARARRGFVGLFHASREGYFDVVGRTNLSAGDQVEITDAGFAERLRGGRPVVERYTLLAPILEGETAAGFFCIDQPADGQPFEAGLAEYLVMLGRLATTRVHGGTTRRGRQQAAHPPLEWPIDMVGKSKPMEELRREIREAAAGGANVLVTGETGTGKELVAHAIHAASGRRGPFLARNCAAITETLAEAEIFGHAARSGIAGADPEGAPGWFEQAHQGTLFLDEIQGLNLGLQDKFLRVLQEKEVWRVRGRRPVAVEVQAIAATDCDLERAIEEGAFRQPFYFRFGKRIQLPPLRARKEDIPLLTFYFLDRYARRLESPVRTVSHRAMQKLLASDWPGNVRELENSIRAAVAKVSGRDILFSWDLPEGVRSSAAPEPESPAAGRVAEAAAPPGAPVPKAMAEVEKEKIMEALEVSRGNISRAARLLGYRSRQTMLNKLDRYGIPREYGDPDLT